ncbi:MAG: secretin N-terminal domain-containing protein [Candidatus Omnitrophota bacterium]
MKNKFIFVLILFLSGAMPSLAQAYETGTAPQPPTASQQNKISLDIKGMDIVDVLKMISNRSGMNLAIGKNVTGKVTLFLKDVDIFDAFEIILLANDLAYIREGNIINVMTQRDYELTYGGRFKDRKEVKIVHLQYAKAADLSRALTQMKTNVGRIVPDDGSNTLVLMDSPETIKAMQDFISKADVPLETRVFSLNYAVADKLSEKLQDAVTKGIGSVKKDERTNKVVVTDYPNKLKEIARIIKAFDEKTPQVLIDAQIIEITPSDSFTMGVDWGYWIEKYFKVLSSLPGGSVGGLTLGTANTTLTGAGQYKAVLDALRTIGDTKIISSPRIVATNNQEASILVGRKQTYLTSSAVVNAQTTTTTVTPNTLETGIKLHVTPTINRDNFITMKIKPEISEGTLVKVEVNDQGTDVPDLTTSEAETTVMVKDGVTIIIGGLHKDKHVKTVKKIPLAGDIPGLGFLFRSVSDVVTKDELVILLTPHIITGEEPYSNFSDIKPKEGFISKMVNGEIVTERFSTSVETESLNSMAAAGIPSDYRQSIIAKIQNVAKSAGPKKMKGRVLLSFRLLQNGNLIGEPDIINTTDNSLVEPAVKAIKEASPFGHFPDKMAKPEETFKINLIYE